MALMIGANALLIAILSTAAEFEDPARAASPPHAGAGRRFVFGLCPMGVGSGLSVRWPADGVMVIGAGVAVLAFAILVGVGPDSETGKAITVILIPGAGYTGLGLRELDSRRAMGVEGARSATLDS